MVNPKHIHLIGEKHVMRYLKGTLDFRVLHMHLVARSNYMDIQIQIGEEVPKIEKSPQDVA